LPEAARAAASVLFSTRPRKVLVAKDQQKSNREKRKPKQDKTKVTPPSASPFSSSGAPGNPAQKGVPRKRR
jgi:hypothetical protein